MNQEAKKICKEYRREVGLVGRGRRKKVWFRSEVEELRSGSDEEMEE